MKIKFARFGGLSSVNQRGYKSNPDSFHGPPCRRGFYAFVWPHYDFFLLSNGKTTMNPWNIGTKFRYVKDAKGNVIDDKHPEFKELSGKHKYWTVHTKLWYNHIQSWADLDILCDNPDYDKELTEAVDKVKKFLSLFDDNFYQTQFGDHVMITVTESGIDTEDYEHD